MLIFHSHHLSIHISCFLYLETSYFGASIKIGPGKMGKDILNKTGKGGILDIVTGCPGSDKTREEVIERWAAKEK